MEKIRGEQIKRGVDPSEWVGGGPEEAMEEQDEEEEEEEISEEKGSEVDKPIATEVCFLFPAYYCFCLHFLT